MEEQYRIRVRGNHPHGRMNRSGMSFSASENTLVSRSDFPEGEDGDLLWKRLMEEYYLIKKLVVVEAPPEKPAPEEDTPAPAPEDVPMVDSPATVAPLTVESLVKEHSYPELQRVAVEMGIPAKGTEVELATRIVEARTGSDPND